MNRGLIFYSPFWLGFEHTRNIIERAAKAAAESYPPYNVEDLGEGSLRITLAVAGFSPDQLQVTVEDRQLVVAGKRDAVASPRGASSGASSWRTAWWWRPQPWSMACSTSTWPGRNRKNGCSASPSGPPAELRKVLQPGLPEEPGSHQMKGALNPRPFGALS